MWRKPRATIQQIVDTDPRHMVLVLAALAGIFQSLDRAIDNERAATVELPMIFLLSAVIGSIGGIITLYISSSLIRFTGKLFSGKGSALNLRAALAWANVPTIWALLLMILAAVVFGKELFTGEVQAHEWSLTSSISYAVFGLSIMILGIWSFILMLKSIGQVQGFSAWMALANVILAFLIVFIPFMAFILLFLFAGGPH